MIKKTYIMLLIACAFATSLLAVSCGTETDPTDFSVNSDGETVSDLVTDNSSAAPDDGKVTYTVAVVDVSDNTPIEGIIIQFCDDDNCKLPLVTDADGKATAEYEQSNYHITITAAEGYVYASEYYFEDGETEITIVLDSIAPIS